VNPINNDVDRDSESSKLAQAAHLAHQAADDIHNITADSDPAFLWRRLQQAAKELDAYAHLVEDQARRLRTHEAEQIPAHVAHAMAGQTARMRAVETDIGRHHLVLAIPPEGIPDPHARQQLWQQLKQRYGHGGPQE
jgi:hypothetical protein